MLIGLISDTHIAFPYETIPPQIAKAFRGVDLILHAGDIWIPSVLDELESIAPVMAAWGDDDMPEHFTDDKRMLQRHTLSLGGVVLWLTHVKPSHQLRKPAVESSLENRPDVVVFGHTHFASIEPNSEILWVNPGSATMPSYVPKLGNVALLHINAGEVKAHIVQLE